MKATLIYKKKDIYEKCGNHGRKDSQNLAYRGNESIMDALSCSQVRLFILPAYCVIAIVVRGACILPDVPFYCCVRHRTVRYEYL